MSIPLIENENMIQMLRELSPVVEDGISTKTYLLLIDSEDYVTTDFLLLYCYQLVQKELEEIGIIFTDELEELFDNYYSMSSIYYLRKYLDPQMVIDNFKLNKNNNIIFLNILEDENIFDALLEEYIDYLNYCSPNIPELEKLYDIIDKINNNDKFKIYLTNMLNEVSEEESINVTEEYLNNYNHLLEIVQTDRNNFREAVLKVIPIIYNFNDNKHRIQLSIDDSYLMTKIKQYDLSKINGTDSRMYAWCYSVDPSTLNSALLRVYDQYMDKHHLSTTHHIEYWIIDKYDKKPNVNNLIELICHVYNPVKSLNDQLKEKNDIVDKLIENELITQDQLFIIDLLSKTLWDTI